MIRTVFPFKLRESKRQLSKHVRLSAHGEKPTGEGKSLAIMLSIYWTSLRHLAQTVRWSLGKFPRECALCGYRGKFLGHGYPYICDSLCPKCGSREAHRLLALANREYDFFRDRDVLHFAPETFMRELVLAHRPRSYLTADHLARNVDRRENIEALTIKDGCFDVVICLDVLDQVNDRKAASELFRVLRPGGILMAMFPIVEGWDDTFEEETLIMPEERLLYFGRQSQTRFFGRDARRRLADPGFIVEEYTAVEPNVSRYALTRGEKLFILSRPSLRRRGGLEREERVAISSDIAVPAELQSSAS